ncbi:glycosyltransferase family 4 protein [Fundidesulfovibrio butyratiphilus]
MARKIKLIVNALPLTTVNTGIGRHLRCLYEQLENDHGRDFEIAYFDGRQAVSAMPPPPKDVSGRSRLTSLLWRMPAAVGLGVRLAVHARREWAFRQAAKGFDIYHEASFFPFLAPRGVKTVFTIHDLSLLRYPEHHPRERVLYNALFFKRRLKRVSRFFAVSRFTRQEMSTWLRIDPSRTDVTYNAVDQTRFHPRPGGKTVPGLAPGEPYFLFLGTKDPRKNPQVIAPALAKSGLDIPLVLAGWSGWSGRDSGGARVVELGYVPDEDLPGLYSNALALVYPSLYEGFGLPVLEAMACGCPVITARSSSLPEVGGEACLYLEDPSDPEEMAQAMLRLARTPGLADEMRTKGLVQAERFSWADSAQVAAQSFLRLPLDRR